MSESTERKIAFSIIWWIIKEKGGKAEWSSTHLESFKRAEKIASEYEFNVAAHLDQVLASFPRERKSGKLLLPPTIAEPPKPEALASSVFKETKETKVPPSNLIDAAKQYYDMSEKMLDAYEYLSKWRSSPEGVISELSASVDTEAFIPKYENPPAAFEFMIAEALCSLFQVQLFVEYDSSIPYKEKNCVIWRGDLENYKPAKHAPGGGSDMVVFARGYCLLAEATLRYSPRQWKEEVEPIFRHLKVFIEQSGFCRDDVYLVFVTPRNVLKETYGWIRARAEEFNVVTLDVENLVKLVKASLLIVGMPHAEIRRALMAIHKRVMEDVIVDGYVSHINDDVDKWCHESLQPYFNLFLATKSFELLVQHGGLYETSAVIKELSEDSQVKDYIELGGIASAKQSYQLLEAKKRDLIGYLSIFGLAREINGFLKVLKSDEFDARLLKIYSHIKKIKRPISPS